MNYRTLGRTGLQVSALAMGTVELGLDYGIRAPGHYGRPPEEEAIRLVHAAIDAGINLLDTARAYGISEEILGRALKDRRDRVVLATKVVTQQADGATPTGEGLRRRMLDSLDTSLRELQTDWVEIWQIHNLDQSLLDQIDLLAAIFDEARGAGKVRWVGASTYGVEMPLAAVRSGIFDMVQVTYSVFDQRLADAVFPLAAAQEVGVLVRSVLLQGVLTERADHLPDHLEPLRARSRRFRQIVAENAIGLSPAQVALAFALAHPHISAALMGVRTLTELTENLQAVEATLPAELLDQLYPLRMHDADLLNPGTWRH
ncbi:MAG: aldo/keto reductase [Caldilineaceae bacterium]|nr:aldo/keto reductase [Caldilineaceae bacterium]